MNGLVGRLPGFCRIVGDVTAEVPTLCFSANPVRQISLFEDGICLIAVNEWKVFAFHRCKLFQIAWIRVSERLGYL